MRLSSKYSLTKKSYSVKIEILKIIDTIRICEKEKRRLDENGCRPSKESRHFDERNTIISIEF